MLVVSCLFMITVHSLQLNKQGMIIIDQSTFAELLFYYEVTFFEVVVSVVTGLMLAVTYQFPLVLRDDYWLVPGCALLQFLLLPGSFSDALEC